MKPSSAYVLRLLEQREKGLTSLEALHLGAGSRLAARVSDLRRDGYDIRTERVPGKPYVRYRLVEKAA